MIIETNISPEIAPFLDSKFPDECVYFQGTFNPKVGCYSHKGIEGMALFEDFGAGRLFVNMLPLTQRFGSLKKVTFDEAREIAKSRPLPVVALHLMDANGTHVVDTHFVK